MALKFIYQLLARAPFKNDKYYEEDNLPYETRRLFANLVKVNNKALFFESRTRIFNSENSDMQDSICRFYDIEYPEEE